MKKIHAFFALGLTSISAIASDFQWSNRFEYFYTDNSDIDFTTEAFSLGTKYYFTPQSPLGPLAELEYINDNDFLSLSASYSEIDFDLANRESKNFSVAGEFIFDKFIIGGSYIRRQVDEEFTSFLTGTRFTYDYTQVDWQASLGYFLQENWTIAIESIESDSGNDSIILSTEYTHHLTGNDYIGFTASVDEDAESYFLSGKYFSDLGTETYLAAGFAYSLNTEFDIDRTSLFGDYYFSKYTSVGLTYNIVQAAENDYGLRMQHFLSDKLSVGLRYFSNFEDEASDTYTLNIEYRI
ncbi:MAG: putative porin [Pseudomonadota bacterium]